MRTGRALVSAVALVALAATGAASAVTVEETFEATYPFTPGGELALENVNGSVHIETWQRAEIRIEAEKQARASSRSRAEELLQELEIVVEESAGRITVETRHPRSEGFLGWLTGGGDASASYRVWVPAEIDLDIVTVNGRIEAEGPRGDLRLRSTNGRIVLEDAGGSLRASTTNGSIDAELSEVSADAELSLSTTNGGITLALPAGVRAELSARTVNGSIESDLPLTIEGRMSKRRISGALNGGGGGRVELSTTNGSIRIRER